MTTDALAAIRDELTPPTTSEDTEHDETPTEEHA